MCAGNMYNNWFIIFLLLFTYIAIADGSLSFATRSHKNATACYVFEPYLKEAAPKGLMRELPVDTTEYFTELCGKCSCMKTYRSDVLLLECRTCPRRLETLGCAEARVDFRVVKYPKCCEVKDACAAKEIVLV